MEVIPPHIVLGAYTEGVFPMSEEGEIHWFSPTMRGIIPIDDSFHIPRGLKKTLRKKPFEIRQNTAFREVMEGCSNRSETWIDNVVKDTYNMLYDLGYAHSFECWDDEGLQGGLYGVAIDQAFFGESMFSKKTDASKVALVYLVEWLRENNFKLLDTQWMTNHLRQFGGREVSRDEYLKLLESAMDDGSPAENICRIYMPKRIRNPRTRFRPCIDLHGGKVKQIVGGTLQDEGDQPQENFVSEHDAGYFAEMFRERKLRGGHVIQLGPGNEEAARQALAAWPGGLQLGGGVTIKNAADWLEAGASHVIVTSWLFDKRGRFLKRRLRDLANEIGRERIVVDLSCRRTKHGWTVAMNRWQTLTSMHVTHDTLDMISQYCSELLIHAVDVEGLCNGVDRELISLLSSWGKMPITYAGGVATMKDFRHIHQRSGGLIDATVGSALDIFGGDGIKLDELVEWNRTLL